MFRSSARRRVVTAFLALTFAFGIRSHSVRAQEVGRPITPIGREAAQPGVLTVAPETTVRYGEPWTPSTAKYANAHELIRAVKAKADEGARVVITTEQRLDHADAKKRLIDIAHSRSVEPTFSAIGGWPAVELRFQERLPTMGIKDGTGRREPSPLVHRAIVAIAAEDRVLRFDIWLSPGVGAELLNEGIAIARSASFAHQANPGELERTLDELKRSAAQQGGSKPPTDGGGQPGGGRTELNVSPGPPTSPEPGVGEIEITSNKSGKQIAIATNGGVVFSANGGSTFKASKQAALAIFGDPTITRGASGAFYLGGVAFPTGQLGFTGCADSVSRSTDGGANFALKGFSAKCSAKGDTCAPDQPHIAADPFESSASNQDQIYAVFRNFTPTPCLSCPGPCSSPKTFNFPGWQTSVLVCSQNNGATWTNPPLAIPGGGDHPRVAVGRDGKVYVVTLDGSSVNLTRYSSCTRGLVPEPGFPVTVESGFPASQGANVDCPLPGLDRCDSALTSQMVAPDPAKADHLFVTYARPFEKGGEQIVARESHDAGHHFGGELPVSPLTAAKRFMPWSCSSLGSVFVGWYDRTAAKSGPSNDLTDYLVGSPIFPTPVNLSVKPDAQCASGWPTAPLNQNDSESCSRQPQLAGRCLNGSGGGSNKPCDFSSTNCPSGESCQQGAGSPKYGDYNGIACTDDKVIAAWASATAPPGLPKPAGLAVFSRVIPLTAPASWDRLQVDVTTGEDDLRDSSEVTFAVTGEGSFCLKPSTSTSPDSVCANGPFARDQTGRSGWDHSNGVITQKFTLPTPKTSVTSLGTMTITLIQESCFGCTSDNWNIEDITVSAIDSTGTLPPKFLLSLTSNSGSVDDQSCVIRLKDKGNAQSVKLSLANPPTNTHVYVGGPSNGKKTTCKNNGDQ